VTPLNKARSLLAGDTVIAVVKGNTVLTSPLRGIAALLAYVKNGDLDGASLADKIVGKAAALLMVLGKVKEVYAGVITEEAKAVFVRYNVPFCFSVSANKIMNRQGTDICPMENAVLNISDPQEAFDAVSEKLIALSRGNK